MKRKTNFELLRIVAMIMILFHHLALHTTFRFDNSLSLGKMWVDFINIGGQVGVTIFVLITGYFMVSSDKIKLQKIIKMWLQLVFYGLTLYCVLSLFKVTNISIGGILHTFMPVADAQWWFMSTYFVLYIFSPCINKMLNNIDKKTYKTYLIIGFIFFSIIPTILGKSFESNNLVWFVFLYSVGAYIRLYESDFQKTNRTYIVGIFIFVFIAYLIKILFRYIPIYFVASIGNRIYLLQSFAIFGIGLFIFLLFRQLNIKENKFINKMAAVSLGVYIIHDNNYIRSFLWNNLVKTMRFDSFALVMYSIFAVILVYAVCGIIEYIRMNYLEKIYMDKIDKLIMKIGKHN